MPPASYMSCGKCRPAGLSSTRCGVRAAIALKVLHAQLDAHLVGDGRQVQAGVGRAADGHIHGDGVLERLLGHDVARQEVLRVQVHNQVPGLPGQGDARAVRGRGQRPVGHGHAQRLGQHVHTVGRAHQRAGAGAGVGRQLERRQFLVAHLAPLHRALGLDQVGVADPPPLKAARLHRPAADQDGRDVEPRGGHQHARRDLVAVGEQHHGVKGVGRDHQLDRVGDQLAADHRHAHARRGRSPGRRRWRCWGTRAACRPPRQCPA